MNEKPSVDASQLTGPSKFGMRYNAYQLPKIEDLLSSMGYGSGLMDEKNRDKGMERGGGLLEVHRGSPYEFCLTSEPCVGAGFEVAKSVIVSPRSDSDTPIVALSVTFPG